MFAVILVLLLTLSLPSVADIMDSNAFREAGVSAIDESKFPLSSQPGRTLNTLTVISYFDTISSRDVVSKVEPGYLRTLLPSSAPQEGESWKEIQSDIESKIMPGITHWYPSLFPSSHFPHSVSKPPTDH